MTLDLSSEVGVRQTLAILEARDQGERRQLKRRAEDQEPMEPLDHKDRLWIWGVFALLSLFWAGIGWLVARAVQ